MKGGDLMKEHIEQINHTAEFIYSITRDKYTISKDTAKTLQECLDEMQEELDKIANELYQPEHE